MQTMYQECAHREPIKESGIKTIVYSFVQLFMGWICGDDDDDDDDGSSNFYGAGDSGGGVDAITMTIRTDCHNGTS